jgi:hypothetical protein
MNPRDPELQAMRLARLFLMDWPPNSMLKKIAGEWMLLPVPKEAKT